MPSWTCCFTKKDNIRNEHAKRSVKLVPVTKKISEKRLNWYGHVKRREEGDYGEYDRKPGGKILVIYVYKLGDKLRGHIEQDIVACSNPKAFRRQHMM